MREASAHRANRIAQIRKIAALRYFGQDFGGTLWRFSGAGNGNELAREYLAMHNYIIVAGGGFQ